MTTVGEVRGISLLGGGLMLPGEPIFNLDALRRVEAHRDWSEDRLAFAAKGLRDTLGLEARHWAHQVGAPLDPATEASTLDLILGASRRALDQAGVDASELSLVLATTSTPHRMTSTISAAVGAELGVAAACIDVRGGCSAGMFALATAASFLAGDSRYVLIAGGETFSKVAPPSHKMAVLSVGDGAAAIVLGKGGEGILHAAFSQTDGKLGGLVTTEGAMPPTIADIERGAYQLSGMPEELTEALPEKYLDAIHRALERAGKSPADIDLFVPHQTTRPLVEKVCAELGIPAAKTYTDGIARHANIGAGGWIAGLVGARDAGRCPPGTTVLVAAVGGGMSWGAAVWTL